MNLVELRKLLQVLGPRDQRREERGPVNTPMDRQLVELRKLLAEARASADMWKRMHLSTLKSIRDQAELALRVAESDLVDRITKETEKQ